MRPGTTAETNARKDPPMLHWVAFLILAAAGQFALFLLSRFVLLRAGRRLQRRYGFSDTALTDISVTIPLLLQVVWLMLVIGWLMQ